MPDTPTTPRRFLEEFTEVFVDLQFDLSSTILELDPEVGRRVNHVVAELFKQGNGNPEKTMELFRTSFMWYFMAGREHALRGYASPVPKTDAGSDGWVPDDIGGIMGGPL